MTVREYKSKVYEEYKEEIDKISLESKEERPEGIWQADIGVATDMFITKVLNSDYKPEAKAKIVEWKAQITE